MAPIQALYCLLPMLESRLKPLHVFCPSFSKRRLSLSVSLLPFLRSVVCLDSNPQPVLSLDLGVTYRLSSALPFWSCRMIFGVHFRRQLQRRHRAHGAVGLRSSWLRVGRNLFVFAICLDTLTHYVSTVGIFKCMGARGTSVFV